MTCFSCCPCPRLVIECKCRSRRMRGESMPLDGLTLGYVARELDEALKGGRVERVTQPEKDIILLAMRAGGKNQKLLLCASPAFARAHLTEQNFSNPIEAPLFAMLLRKHLTYSRLDSVECIKGDRVLCFSFESRNEMGDPVQKQLYLEIMGHHSNLTLVCGGRIIDAARRVGYDMSRVRQALPGLDYVLPPLQDKIDPREASEEELHALLTSKDENATDKRLDRVLSDGLRGLSAAAAKEIACRVTGMEAPRLCDTETAECARRLHSFLQSMDHLLQPCVQYDDTDTPADFYPFPYLSRDTGMQKPVRSLSAAIDRFYSGRDRQDRLRQKSLSLRRTLKNLKEKEERKLALQQEEIDNAAQAEKYRIWGELLNAQLYLVPRGVSVAALPDLYDENCGTVEIPLEVSLTPAQNAQKYFKRYRKARNAAHLAAEQAEKTRRSLLVLETAEDDLDRCETDSDFADIRDTLAAAGLVKAAPAAGKKKKREESRPLTFTSPSGLQIRVGKNSAQNERITSAARPGDIWLHAKDIPGSHVVIRREGNAPVPEEDILYAARLASYYSKGKGRSVTVDYTDRKYVKKPAGTPEGFVTYTGQRSLLVDGISGLESKAE
ncbi:MAG: hypothetical protein CW338_05280 [Clostridiales bacterium]|nr:hypothetical protein [Clostridiales bacterium]